MATGQLLRVVHTILTILAEQVEDNPPVRGEEAPGTPPGLFVGPTLLGAPDSPEADGNVMDKVGADAPCVADEPEAETLYLPENPRLRATPPRQRPGLADPACPGLTSMTNWNGQEALRNTTLLTDLDPEALERTNPRWFLPWLNPLGVRYCKKTRANQLCC